MGGARYRTSTLANMTLTKNDLLSLARELRLVGYSHMNKYELYVLVNSHWRGPAAIEHRLDERLHASLHVLRDSLRPQLTFTSFFWYLVWQLTGYANPDSLIKRE